MIVFRVDSKIIKKILKSSDHWVKNMFKIITLRQKRADVLIHEVQSKECQRIWQRTQKSLKKSAQEYIRDSKWTRQNDLQKISIKRIIRFWSCEL